MSWEYKARSWTSMPITSSLFFFGGVFCLFAALILVGSSMNSRSESAVEMIAGVLVGGLFAIAWAYAGTRRILWWFFALGPLEFVAFSILAQLSGPHQALSGEDLAQKLQRNGFGAILLIVAAYVLFLVFFNREGARFFRTQTEVRQRDCVSWCSNSKPLFSDSIAEVPKGKDCQYEASTDNKTQDSSERAGPLGLLSSAIGNEQASSRTERICWMSACERTDQRNWLLDSCHRVSRAASAASSFLASGQILDERSGREGEGTLRNRRSGSWKSVAANDRRGWMASQGR